MTPSQLKDLFRSDVRDEAEPPLWSDPEIYAYMDDAQKMFCRLTGGLADSSTPEICNIRVTAGRLFAPYDKRILKLRDLRRESDGRNVTILNFEDLARTGTVSDDYGQFHGVGDGAKFSSTVGPVDSVVVGMDANKLRITNVPQADDVLQAIVYRLPLNAITGAADEEFEIDDQHVINLLDWMKYRAHKKQDAETYDRGRSAEFEQVFLAYCDQCKAERERREHKYRTVAYGGI